MMNIDGDAMARERLRQSLLLQALWRQPGGDAAGRWLQPLQSGIDATRGLRAYQANAGAAIERALASSYPTVQVLIGEESFAALARAYWHAHPPARGDLACAGDALPAFIAASDVLADVPYLADVARLDAALDTAERAADAAWQADTLALLGSHDPNRLHIELMPGTAVLSSSHPIVMLRDAHHRDGDDPFAEARQALAAGTGEHALVWRTGFRAACVAIDEATARWTRALLDGDTLTQAFDRAGDGFDFERWLIAALERGWLARIHAQ